jgi:hypothetical protein
MEANVFGCKFTPEKENLSFYFNNKQENRINNKFPNAKSIKNSLNNI